MNIFFEVLFAIAISVILFLVYDFSILFFLKKRVFKELTEGERIIYAKKVNFYLKSPMHTFYSEKPYYTALNLTPAWSMKLPKNQFSSAGIFLTSKNRLILLANRPKGNWGLSDYQILLDLDRDSITNTQISDYITEGDRHKLNAKMLVIKTNKGDNYDFGLYGLGINKILGNLNKTSGMNIDPQIQSFLKVIPRN